MLKKSFYIFLLSLLTINALAQEKSPDCYQVKLDHQSILCLSKIGSIDAQERGKVVEKRIKALANEHSFSPNDIRIEEANNFYHIIASEMPIVSLGPSDQDNVTSVSGQAYAQLVVERIQTAINNYREEYSLRSILKGLLYTLLTSIAFFIVWKGCRNTFDFLRAKVDSVTSKILNHAKIKSYHLLNPEKARAILSSVISGTQALTGLILIYFYITIVLNFFPWTAGFAPQVLSYLLDPLFTVFKTIIDYIPNIFFIIVIWLVTHYFAKLVKVIFNEIESGNLTFSGFHKEWAQPTFKLLRGLIYALALVMIFPYLPGSSSPAFQGLSVFLGVVISFSSGSAIANIIAGIVITYMRPFKLGDLVKIADTTGNVVEKNFLVTRIKTNKNTDITIPNTMVLGSHIINYSSNALKHGLILHTTIGVSYDVDWRTVHDLLKTAAQKTDLIDHSKEPFILQTALQDSTVAYELNTHTKHANDMVEIYSDLHRHIVDLFKEKISS